MKKNVAIFLLSFMMIFLRATYYYALPDNFYTNSNCYVLTEERGVLFEEPHVESKTNKSVRRFSFMEKISQTNVRDQRWIYVKYPFGGSHQTVGWIEERQVLNISLFKPIFSFDECYIEGGESEFEFEIQFYKDGNYFMRYIGDNGWKIKKGKIYSSRIQAQSATNVLDFSKGER